MAECSLGKRQEIQSPFCKTHMQTTIDRCLARSNTYGFLSQVYLRGAVPELYTYIEAIPELASGLGSTGGESAAHTYNQDELAADHYRVFGLNVLPYESSFLEPQHVLDGPVTERVLKDYWAAGFRPEKRNVSADHIGLELKFLGDLCKTQAEAEGDQRVDISSHILAQQWGFLETHLLRWLPGLVQAVKQLGSPFYSALLELTLDLAIDHYEELSGRMVNHQSHAIQDFKLPEIPDILADENTRIKDIASYLLTPAYSGVYFSREVIEGLAKSLDLPRGFGDRGTMLTNLLRNAADYEKLASLLDALQSILDHWVTFYAHLPRRCQDENLLKPFASLWQSRIQASQKMLTQIQTTIPEDQ